MNSNNFNHYSELFNANQNIINSNNILNLLHIPNEMSEAMFQSLAAEGKLPSFEAFLARADQINNLFNPNFQFDPSMLLRMGLNQDITNNINPNFNFNLANSFILNNGISNANNNSFMNDCFSTNQLLNVNLANNGNFENMSSVLDNFNKEFKVKQNIDLMNDINTLKNLINDDTNSEKINEIYKFENRFINNEVYNSNFNLNHLNNSNNHSNEKKEVQQQHNEEGQFQEEIINKETGQRIDAIKNLSDFQQIKKLADILEIITEASNIKESDCISSKDDDIKEDNLEDIKITSSNKEQDLDVIRYKSAPKEIMKSIKNNNNEIAGVPAGLAPLVNLFNNPFTSLESNPDIRMGHLLGLDNNNISYNSALTNKIQSDIKDQNYNINNQFNNTNNNSFNGFSENDLINLSGLNNLGLNFVDNSFSMLNPLFNQNNFMLSGLNNNTDSNNKSLNNNFSMLMGSMFNNFNMFDPNSIPFNSINESLNPNLNFRKEDFKDEQPKYN